MPTMCQGLFPGLFFFFFNLKVKDYECICKNDKDLIVDA